MKSSRRFQPLQLKPTVNRDDSTTLVLILFQKWVFNLRFYTKHSTANIKDIIKASIEPPDYGDLCKWHSEYKICFYHAVHVLNQINHA